MPSSPPFIDRETEKLDTDQLLAEAVPLAKLIGLVAILALVPLIIATSVGIFPWLLVVITQFILAVGFALVLIYVITRGIQLAEE